MNIKKMISLTVAIPTYNRASELEKTILKLSKEVGSFYILISDNNSTDNTEEVVKKYQKLIPNLIYNKNRLNLGYSGNVCRLYELSRTPYIWFLCDDDSILPGAIHKILSIIAKYRPTVALFSHTWNDPYGRRLFSGVNHEIVYQKIEELPNYFPLIKGGFLSILIVRKSISIAKLKNTNYKDNVFFQISLVLQLLSSKFRLCDASPALVHRNVGYKYGEFFKTCMVDLLKSVHIVKHGFDNSKFINLKKRMLFEQFQLYLSQKLGLFNYEGQITTETRRFVFKYYGIFYGSVIMTFPLIKFIIPTILIKSIYLLTLLTMHGYKKGMNVYRNNINRAYKDKRNTGFT